VLLEQAARAEADLAAASGTVAGRVRIATFQSVALTIVLPAMEALIETAPKLRCELIEAEPEQALPALATGDVDIAIGDHWQHQPWRLPPGLERHDLLRDPVQLVLPQHHPATRHAAVPLSELRDAVWTTGHPAMGWEDMTQRTCRLYGGFEPDIRHRTNDATVSLALVARGLAVTLLPDLVTGAGHPGVALRPIADAPIERSITAVTRGADATRPSVRAVLDRLRAQRPEHGEREHHA